jgi:hypothetical protein
MRCEIGALIPRPSLLVHHLMIQKAALWAESSGFGRAYMPRYV